MEPGMSSKIHCRNIKQSPHLLRVGALPGAAGTCISNGRQAIYRVPLRGTYRHKFIAGTNNQYSRLVRVCVLARCRRHLGVPSRRRRRPGTNSQYSRFLRVGVLAWCLRHPGAAAQEQKTIRPLMSEWAYRKVPVAPSGTLVFLLDPGHAQGLFQKGQHFAVGFPAHAVGKDLQSQHDGKAHTADQKAA